MISVFMRFPEGRAKAVTFSYDDGAPQDKRLAEISFFINNFKVEKSLVNALFK